MRSLVMFCGLLLLVGIPLPMLTGCSSGISSLTGGSIPIGDIDGQVWRSPTRSLSTVSEVTVELWTPDETRVRTTVTDAEGRFAFRGVQQGRWLLRAQDAGEEARIDVEVQSKQQVIVALRLSTFSPTVEALWITPDDESIVMAVGETLQIHAWDRPPDDDDRVLLPVSWAVQGRFGHIAPDGLLTTLHVGSGRVIAQYGAVSSSVSVRVLAVDADQ